MPLQTRVCDFLGIEAPVLLAGMASVTNAELVAAVSNAGGLGIIGSVDRAPEGLVAEVARIRSLTDRPFGINVVIADAPPEIWEAVFALRPPVLATSWGDVAPFMGRARAAGCRVIHQVNTADGARRAAAAGVDAVIAQGAEGGGHVGAVSTVALVPAAVDAAGGTPVIAAGGIVDGRGLAAALALGAEGVLVGTRFLATPEAPIPPAWKQALLDNPGENAVATPIPDLAWDVRWPGATSRVLRNALIDEWQGREHELSARRAEVAARIDASRAAGRFDDVPLYAGQGIASIADLLPAAEIVHRMVAEANAIIGRLPGRSR